MPVSFAQEVQRICLGTSFDLIEKAAAIWYRLSKEHGYTECEIRAAIAETLQVPMPVVVFWQTAYGWKMPRCLKHELWNAHMLCDDTDDMDLEDEDDELAVFYRDVVASAARYVSEDRIHNAQMIIYKAVRGYFQDVVYLSPSNAPIKEVQAVIEAYDFNLHQLALLYGMQPETLEQYLVIHHRMDREALHHNRVAVDWKKALKNQFLTRILYRTWAALYAKGLPYKEIGRRHKLQAEIIAMHAKKAGEDLWPKCDPEFLDLLKTWLMGHLAEYRSARKHEKVAQSIKVVSRSGLFSYRKNKDQEPSHSNKVASTPRFEQTCFIFS